MAYQQFFGKFTLGTSANDFAVGANAVSLTTGDYYISGATGETDDLCSHIQTKIRAIGATQDASTVAYSATTGKITITLETAATLTFTDTALATVLGFTSTSYSSGTTFTAERQPRYVWRPTRSAWDYPLNLTAATFWVPRSTSHVGRANDGTSWSVAGTTVYDAWLSYKCLTEAEVKTPSTGTTYADLQQFFVDVAAAGMPIRFYPDRTLNATTDIVTFAWGDDKAEELGSWLDYASQHTSTYRGLWDIDIPMMKYVV